MENKTYKIQSVQVENILKVKFANIAFKDDIVVIGGENGAGKSSVAKAIWMAFAGKKGVPEKPVRDGAETGSITVELDNDLVLKALVKPDREIKLELMDKDGSKYRNAHDKLKDFNFHYGYFPQDFLEAEPKTKVETLMQIGGLDFNTLNRERDTKFEQRTDVNRELKKAQALLTSIPAHPDASETEILTADLLEELNAAQSAAKLKATLEWDAQIASNKALSCSQTAQNNRDKAAELIRDAEDYEQLAEKYQQQHLELLDDAKNTQVPDIQAIQERIRKVDSENVKVRQCRERANIQVLIEDLEKKANELTCRLQGIEEEKHNLVAKAKLPVTGLGFNENGVTLNGFPFEQASDAQQWAAAIAIGFAMKPKLKLVYVRHGSLLTEKTRQMVYDLTRQHGGQLLFEIAGDGPDVSVIMEDGEVVEVRNG